MPVGKNRDPVRSTFPIPEGKLRLRKLATAAWSPYTWAPFAATVTAVPFIDAGPLVIGSIFLMVAAGVTGFWRLKRKKLSSALLEDLIEESNQVQDRELVLQARNLLRRGYPDYASTLGSFLERKQQIEKAIHGEGKLTREKREIENLVDAVTFGVCDQLVRLANFDDRLTKPKPDAIPISEIQREKINEARREIGKRVHEAFDIIESTWENLADILDPIGILEKEDASHPELDRAIAKLREERAVAQRIRERMETDWGDRFGPAPNISDEEFGEEAGIVSDEC